MSRDDRNAKPGHALCGYSVSDVGMAKGGKQAAGKRVTLPDGRNVPMNNGSTGFFIPGPHYFQCTESMKINPVSGQIDHAMKLGRAAPGCPDKHWVSGTHVTFAIQNDYYFIKDVSKNGTYVRIGIKGKGERIELKPGNTFSVGQLWLKAKEITGNAAINRKQEEEEENSLDDKEEKEKPEKDEKDDADGDDDLDDDEEYADDSDDDGEVSKNLNKPAKMLLVSADKKLKLKCNFSQTGFIGSDKEKCKLAIKEERAKKRHVEKVHSKIVVEDGRFYLEDAGSAFGTYFGLGKKAYFEMYDGDVFLLGGARFRCVRRKGVFRPLQGLVDLMVGKMPPFDYSVKITGEPNVIKRIHAMKNNK